MSRMLLGFCNLCRKLDRILLFTGRIGFSLGKQYFLEVTKGAEPHIVYE